ncbi:putative beta-lysine N-acetyltransferase [Thermosyntropha sp.]|uniref:putative beta-lysine N-acetyltransferase n=1 Tax=Thermosyntropha sp. TaxID=2740820 RepID=UPI0025ED3536|nr:putative beta-lysine N-acetyltransferase [Thermosyntropha sp.]MBO8159419.1 putative beta-lysine N-acetyltransferase [Thermosyntropha sp.]
MIDNTDSDVQQPINILFSDVSEQVCRIRGKDFYCLAEISDHNQRIYLRDYEIRDKTSFRNMIFTLESLISRRSYSKIWGKIPQSDVLLFSEFGFVQEARIVNYFRKREDAVVCSKFWFDRNHSHSSEKNSQILQLIQKYNPEIINLELPDGYMFKFAEIQDLPGLARLYDQVFLTYPYPITDYKYLASTMDHVIYGLIYKGDLIVAAASAEINFHLKNAEMTDFATLPSERGKKLASIILRKLEENLYHKGITTLYSIARSTSPGINLLFAGAGYKYTGTLINNCNIDGNLEDMNVFCKTL